MILSRSSFLTLALVLLSSSTSSSAFQVQSLTSSSASSFRSLTNGNGRSKSPPTTLKVLPPSVALVAETAATTATTAAASLATSSLSTSLSLPTSLSSLTSPIGSVTVLALVILIHELGHFMAARSFNISVQEFSVGVGPKVFGFTRNVVTGEIIFGNKNESDSDTDEESNTVLEGNNNDEIQFNLRAIPLGGYVRFPENYNATQEFQFEVEADKKRQEINEIVKEQRGDNGGNGLLASAISIINQNKLKEERILALETLASRLDETNNNNKAKPSFFNNLFNNKKNQKKVEETSARSIIIEEDGTVSTPPIEYYDDPNLLQNRGWEQRAVVLVGGVVFNILLAFSLYFGELTVGGGMSRPTFDQGAMISSVPRSDGASAGLLNRGDVILSLNGMYIVHVFFLTLLLLSKSFL